MNKWGWILVVPVLISIAGAQTSPSLNVQNDSSSGVWHDAGPSDRMFFPKDMFWGWAQLDLAPPHNEIDPNQCAGNAGQYGGANAPCSLFARYMLSGILEVRPFGRGPLRRFMVYGAPALALSTRGERGSISTRALNSASRSTSFLIAWGPGILIWGRLIWGPTVPGADS